VLIELLGEREVNYQQMRSEDDFRKYVHELFNS
jgi:hypothetical protein